MNAKTAIAGLWGALIGGLILPWPRLPTLVLISGQKPVGCPCGSSYWTYPLMRLLDFAI